MPAAPRSRGPRPQQVGEHERPYLGRLPATAHRDAPDRRRAAANSSSAARRPAVEPSATSSTSTLTGPILAAHAIFPAMTGTFINVGTVLLGTLDRVATGSPLASGLQERVLAGLGLVTLVIGVDLALAWRTRARCTSWAGSCSGGWSARRSGSRTGSSGSVTACRLGAARATSTHRLRGVLHREPAVLRRPADRRRLDPGRADRRLPGARDQGPARRLRSIALAASLGPGVAFARPRPRHPGRYLARPPGSSTRPRRGQRGAGGADERRRCADHRHRLKLLDVKDVRSATSCRRS